MAASRIYISTGTAKWMRILCRAGLVGPDSKQSVERLPLLTVAKANSAAEKTQWTVLGVGMLMPPSSVMYCSHRFSACRATHADIVIVYSQRHEALPPCLEGRGIVDGRPCIDHRRPIPHKEGFSIVRLRQSSADHVGQSSYHCFQTVGV